jgi:hypothetical protein
MMNINSMALTKRKDERGQTIVLVAVSMVALLGMAVLAIDIVALYMSHSEAQRTADAAALAGAKMFVTSGFTSVQGVGTPPVAQTDLCGSATAAANQAALALGAQTLVGGQAPTVTATCSFASLNNPQITVTVVQTALPVLFIRGWGRTANTVSATAVAEAYNPSGSTASVQVTGVKPWLIPNCDSSNTTAPLNTNCGTSYFVDPTTGSIASNGTNTGAFIGTTITLSRVSTTLAPGPNTFYALNVPINPPTPLCPAAAPPYCGDVGTNDYLDNIACSSTYQFSCGQTIGVAGVTPLVTSGYGVLTRDGARCLIHASGDGAGNGQDTFTPNLGTTAPVEITGGAHNPNPALRGVANISRSDSIVTVPLYNGKAPLYSGLDLCPGGTCNQSATIAGFLQLGIQQTVPGGGVPPQHLQAVILNAAGCNPSPTGAPVSGGGASPVTVRLIQN